jgi:hypothetical protein
MTTKSPASEGRQWVGVLHCAGSQSRWGVWSRLSWGTNRSELVVGRGEAGYTMFTFASEHEAREFAAALPVYARMPSHSRGGHFPLNEGAR